jgi:hypothetical protein
LNARCALPKVQRSEVTLGLSLAGVELVKLNLRFALLAGVLVSSSMAFAQEGEGEGMHRSGFLLDRAEHSRPMLLTVQAVLPYGYFGYGFPVGVGGLFYIPLVKDGFISPVNDEFGIDFGADVIFHLGYAYPLDIIIPVSVLWKFHITDKFAAYAKVGAALRIWPGSLHAVWPDFVTAVGLDWMFSKSIGLRAEVGYPGIKVGLNFAF